jgi:hypothetical protein
MSSSHCSIVEGISFSLKSSNLNSLMNLSLHFPTDGSSIVKDLVIPRAPDSPIH